MSSIYTYSNTVDFDGKMSQSNKEFFRGVINANAGIAPNCSEVKLNVDVVEITFDEPLSQAEETVLASLVTAKYHDSYIFDAIVDAKGTGDFTSVAAAFAAGKTSVYVRDGVYIETSNIVLPDGGQLVGESQSNVKLVLVAGNSVVVDGSGGVKITTGTVAIENKSKIVTGTGTTFTSLVLPYSFILLGTNFYEVVSVQSDTSLTLKETYEGKPMTGMPCLAQKMYTGVKITNLVIVYSAITGLYLRAVRHCSFKGIAVLYCTPNIAVIDSGDSSLYEFICGFSNGVGIVLDNSHSMLCDTLDVYNSSSHGIELKGKSSSNVFDSCSTSNNGGIGFCISGNAFDINIADTVVKHNNDKGLVTDVGSNQIIVSGCTVIENLSIGIHLSGAFGVLSNNIVKYNGGHGLVGSGTHCIATSNQICENGGDGLYYDDGDSCVVSMNRFDGNAANGINLAGNNAVMSSNIVCNNGASGIVYAGANANLTGNNIYANTLHGINLAATAAYAIMSNNQLISNSQKGLLLDVGASNNVITYNILANNATGNVVDNGTGNEFTGNKLV